MAGNMVAIGEEFKGVIVCVRGHVLCGGLHLVKKIAFIPEC